MGSARGIKRKDSGTMQDKPRVAVLFGGPSNEHEVSIDSGQQIIQHLNQDKYQVIPVFITRDGQWIFGSAKQTRDTGFDAKIWAAESGKTRASAEGTNLRSLADIAFLALHGSFGEDGTMQGYLRMIGIPFTGSGVLSSALAFSKSKCKQVYVQAGIPTPRHVDLSRGMNKKGRQDALEGFLSSGGNAWVLKPSQSGSSVGVAFCRSGDMLQETAAHLLEAYEEILVEELVEGPEFSCGVIEQDGKPVVLPPTEIRPKESSFFDYKAKYQADACEEITPAPTSEKVSKQLQSLALASHSALECRGYSRTDMKLSGEDVTVLETNTLPGMTTTSLLPQQAAAAGITYPQLLDIILLAAHSKRISSGS